MIESERTETLLVWRKRYEELIFNISCFTESVLQGNSATERAKDMEQFLKEYVAEKLPPDPFDRVVELFDKYADHFGLDKPEDREAQCDYEEKLNALVCEVRGHDISPIHSNNRELDRCYRCRELAVDLGYVYEGGKWVKP